MLTEKKKNLLIFLGDKEDISHFLGAKLNVFSFISVDDVILNKSFLSVPL